MITAYQHVDPRDAPSSWEYNQSVTNGTYFEYGAELESADNSSVGDSLIVICTLFVPLAIAISAITIIALLIRRMRRAESMQAMDDEEKCTNSSHYYSQQISTEDIPYSVIVKQQQFAQQSYLLNNKKCTPLPVILGLVDPDDMERSRSRSPSVVLQDEVNTRQGSESSVKSSRPRTQSMSIPCNSNSNGNYHNNVVDSCNSIHKMSSSNNSLNYGCSPNGGSGVSPSPSKSSFSDRVLNVLHFPKRIKEQQAEKNRFNIYTVSLETREQLKQIYVY
jgi:hypothetical protein